VTRRIFSIAPHAPFLDTLVARILDGTLLADWPRTGPFWLSDVTIILPTQRARQALADAFERAGHGLLPDIRTLGGDVAEEEPFLPPFDMALPGAVSSIERRLVLSHLVSAWAGTPDGRAAFATPPTPGEILGMAESLGTLIDDLVIEDVSAEALRSLEPQLESEGAQYWQQALRFLEIALEAWPAHLAASGRVDAAALRNLRLDRQADALPILHGERPVIAAGSTGSIPATARLLAAIADLPRGALVLPGFDTSLSPEAVLGAKSPPHGHPHYGLSRLLARLAAAGADVIELAPEIETAGAARTSLVNHALALTETTALWADQRFAPARLAAATEGMAVIAAHTEEQQGRAIAIAAREALGQGRTVGIITPDRTLARRIAAELARFDIVVDDAAGAPLFQSPVGRLARQCLGVATSGLGPIDLMGLLRNRAVTLGRARAELAAIGDDIDLGLLRGQRPMPGIDGLRAVLTANIDKDTKYPARRLDASRGAAVSALLDDLEHALAPITALLASKTLTAPDLVAALAAALEALTAGGGLPEGGDEWRRWVETVSLSGSAGFAFAPIGLDGVLFALMAGNQVRTRTERRRDIAIWGQLEARLQHPDLLILGALNEDIWPGPADPGPWLSRGMRLAVGLEPPERMQGLAAHDFAQALGNPRVVLAFAERVGSSPALPSRLVQRFEAFVGQSAAGELRLRGARWLAAADALDAAPAAVPARRPLPNPPVKHRPRQLSVTEIETLMRSPYDVYAKHVLGLKPIDPLGAVPDARERGTVIHAIFASFIEEGHAIDDPGALEVLKRLARTAFASFDAIGERRDIWLRRFDHAAGLFLAYERARHHRVAKRHAELSGSWTLPLREPFTLTGRADRIDELTDGKLELIDFKTGSPPQPGQMRAYEAPQLLVEAAMADAGAFTVGGKASDLTYVKIGFGPAAFLVRPFALPTGVDTMEAAEEASRRMQRHIEHFLMTQVAMPARLLPLSTQRYPGAYDHLARTAEWTLLDKGEDEF
jgi:ATP-dependent helicase/nuclease subunit B